MINNANSGSEGWWSKLLHVRKIEPGKDSHSKLLSDTEKVYELQSTVYIDVYFTLCNVCQGLNFRAGWRDSRPKFRNPVEKNREDGRLPP